MIRFASKSITVPLFRVGVAVQRDYGDTIMALKNAMDNVTARKGGAS